MVLSTVLCGVSKQVGGNDVSSREAARLTMPCKVEQRRQVLENARRVSRIREFGAGITELIEEGVNHGINGTQALSGRVLKELGDQVQSVCICLPEDLAEGVRLDLGEFVLHIIGVHRSNLFARRCAKDLDDLHQLIDARLARE